MGMRSTRRHFLSLSTAAHRATSATSWAARFGHRAVVASVVAGLGLGIAPAAQAKPFEQYIQATPTVAPLTSATSDAYHAISQTNVLGPYVRQDYVYNNAQKHLRRHRDGNVDGDLVLSDRQQDPESALVGLG
jgi:hypothetical protein